LAEAGTLHDAFIDELRDTYDAEKQLAKTLPKLAKASSNAKLCQSAIASVTPAGVLTEQHRRMAAPGAAKKANS
jgi:hypothetical protein